MKKSLMLVAMFLAVPWGFADTIHFALTELLAGRMPDLTGLTRFGA